MCAMSVCWRSVAKSMHFLPHPLLSPPQLTRWLGTMLVAEPVQPVEPAGVRIQLVRAGRDVARPLAALAPLLPLTQQSEPRPMHFLLCLPERPPILPPSVDTVPVAEPVRPVHPAGVRIQLVRVGRDVARPLAALATHAVI